MCLLVPVEAKPNKPRTPCATNITLQSVFNKDNSCPGNLLKIHLDGDKTSARCNGERTTDVHQTSKSQYKPTLALLLKVPRSLVSGDCRSAYFQLHEFEFCLVIILTEIVFKFSLIVYFVFQRIYFCYD